MIIQSENLLAKNSKRTKYFFIILLLICLFVSIPIFKKKNSISKNESLTVEEKVTRTSLLGSLINQLNTTTEEAQEEVKVLPIVIYDNSTQETEEKAAQFALLKSRCPINENVFNIDFSYKDDKFDVFVAKNKEEEFWQWLKVNYSSLGKESFTLIEL